MAANLSPWVTSRSRDAPSRHPRAVAADAAHTRTALHTHLDDITCACRLVHGAHTCGRRRRARVSIETVHHSLQPALPSDIGYRELVSHACCDEASTSSRACAPQPNGSRSHVPTRAHTNTHTLPDVGAIVRAHVDIA